MTTLNVIALVGSSNMTHVAHDGTDMLALMRGGNYRYKNVPVSVFEGFMTADSAGKYLNAEVKGKYEYEKLPPEEAAQVLSHPSPRLPVHVPVPTDTVTGRMFTYGGVQCNEANLIMPPGNQPVNWLGGPIPVRFYDEKVAITYAKDGDAAFDLMASTAYSVRNSQFPDTLQLDWPIRVKPGEHVTIGTGISMKLPKGLAGLVLPRSGLARKVRVSVVNSPGLIDSGYTGEIGVLVENRGDDEFLIEQYDRIAQYMIVPVVIPTFLRVAELEQTERGSGGFGSTGVAKNETNGV